MKFRTFTLCLFLFALAILEECAAISIPIVGRRVSDETRWIRRAVDMNGSYGNGSTSVRDSGDTLYFCNITLGGAEFEVLIDTGSSDLWVQGTVPQTSDLKIPASITYVAGQASGSINIASLIFDEYTIPDQAYINVVSSMDNPPTQGVFGLGPSQASNVRQLVNSAKGNTPLDRIFLGDPTTPNFISILLSRVSDDPAGTVPQTGQLTVGSIIPGMQAITSTEKLPALSDLRGAYHWQTVMDANGIIGPDGQNIPTTSTVTTGGGSAQQLRVLLDTGFTFPQVSQNVADAIYGRVPNAQWIPGNGTPGYWRIPCDYELNVTFLFGGVRYPIHPLDLLMVDQVNSATGSPISCMGTFQQISPSIVSDHSAYGEFDMILGMAFLRNVYLLINFGDFVDGSSSNVAAPYFQLLSTTDPSTAHREFVRTRLGGIDTGSQAALVPQSQAQHSPTASYSTNGDTVPQVLNATKEKKPFTRTVRFIAIVVVCGVIGLLLCAAIGYFIWRKRNQRRSKVRTENVFEPDGSYRSIQQFNRESNNHGFGYRADPLSSHATSYATSNATYHVPDYQSGGRQ